MFHVNSVHGTFTANSLVINIGGVCLPPAKYKHMFVFIINCGQCLVSAMLQIISYQTLTDNENEKQSKLDFLSCAASSS